MWLRSFCNISLEILKMVSCSLFDQNIWKLYFSYQWLTDYLKFYLEPEFSIHLMYMILKPMLISRRLQEALEDVNEAVKLAPQTRDVRRVLIKIRDEMQNELDSCVSIDLAQLRQLAASVDTLSEADLPMTSSILSESGYSSNI